MKEHWSKTGFSLGAFGARRVKPAQMPTTHQVDGFAGYIWEGPGAPPHGDPPWGAIYLPPLEKVLGRSKGLIQTSYGALPDDLERTVAGKTWRGGSFEQALRVFDYPQDYCPAAFVMEEGVSDPPIVLADDHSDWHSGRYASFEAYMEHVLATRGVTRARMEWFRGSPNEAVGAPGSLSLDEILPPSIELAPADDGATFEVTVESVEQQGEGGVDPRIAALTKLIPGHRVKAVAKVLGLEPYNRKNEAFIPEIAAATADPKAIDSKTAAKLMGAALQRDKTKAAYLDAFAVGMGGGGGGGGETLTLRVTTCFDRSSLDASEVDDSFRSESTVKDWLGALGVEDADGAWVACELAEATGRKERSAKIVVTLAHASGLEVGRSARSSVVPSGFERLGAKTVRRIF